MKKYAISLLLATSLLAATGTGFAQSNESTPYTLPMCLEIVLDNAYSIKFSRNAEQVAANNATRGNAGMLPNVDAAAGLGGNLNQVEYAGGSTDYNTVGGSYSLGVSGTYTLFDGWGMQASYDRLLEMKKNGALSTKLQIETSMAEATAMYYEIIQRQQKLSNLKLSLSLSRERLRMARETYLAGSRSQVELLQAQGDFNTDSSAYITYTLEVNDLQLRFKKLLLMPFDDDDVMVNDTSFRLNTQLQLDELRELVMKNNTSLQIYSVNRTITDLERKQVEAARYPYVNLNASYGYNGSSSSRSNASGTLGLGASVNVGYKIFDGYNRQRLIANAQIEQLNSKLEYEQQLQQVMSDLYLLHSSYSTYVRLLRLERDNNELANKKIALAMELYSLGQITSLELREHQKTNLDAQDRLVNTMYQAKLSEIYLMQLCGVVLDYLNITPEE